MKAFRHNFDPGEFRFVRDLGDGNALFIPVDPKAKRLPEPRRYNWNEMLAPNGYVIVPGPGGATIRAWDITTEGNSQTVTTIVMTAKDGKFEVINTYVDRGPRRRFR